jgi:hypothetical protein
MVGGSDERLEQKLDALLRKLHPEMAEKIIADLEREYPKR